MVRLMPLGTTDPVYLEAERLFKSGWQHPNKGYHFDSVFYVIQDGPEAQSHLARNRAYLSQVQNRTAGPAEQYLFHGTRRACYTGDSKANVYPCSNPECYFCPILKCSFSLAHASQTGMFGPGIYTSSVSSKADDYGSNHHIRTHKHALFLSNVVTGRQQVFHHASHGRTSPDFGYDSVLASTKGQGGSINYPETVVYREDAILPSVVVMYTRHT